MLSLTKTWQCDIWCHAVRLRTGEQEVMQCARQSGEPLETTLNTLLSTLNGAMPWRDAIEFYLDTDELDFLVVPWQAGIVSPEEWRMVAQLQAEQDLIKPDGASEQWQVRFEDMQQGKPALAACLTSERWQQLAALARQHRLRFQGVVTPFQRLLHPFRQRLPETGLFVCLGDGQSRMACRREGEWKSVFTLTLPPKPADLQLEIITRLAGMPDAPRYVMTTADWRYWQIS